MDTFSLIILCEILKNYSKNQVRIELKETINYTINDMKEKMLREELNVDESFKNQSYMTNYDFSKENIIKRIKRI